MADSRVKKMVVISQAMYNSLMSRRPELNPNPLKTSGEGEMGVVFQNTERKNAALDRMRKGADDESLIANKMGKSNLLQGLSDDDDDNETTGGDGSLETTGGEEYLKNRLYQKLRKLTSKKGQESQVVALAERLLTEDGSQIYPDHVVLNGIRYSILNFCDLVKSAISQKKPDFVQNYAHFIQFLAETGFPPTYIANVYMKRALQQVNRSTRPLIPFKTEQPSVRSELPSPITAESTRLGETTRFKSALGTTNFFSDVGEDEEEEDREESRGFGSPPQTSTVAPVALNVPQMLRDQSEISGLVHIPAGISSPQVSTSTPINRKGAIASTPINRNWLPTNRTPSAHSSAPTKSARNRPEVGNSSKSFIERASPLARSLVEQVAPITDWVKSAAELAKRRRSTPVSPIRKSPGIAVQQSSNRTYFGSPRSSFASPAGQSSFASESELRPLPPPPPILKNRKARKKEESEEEEEEDLPIPAVRKSSRVKKPKKN